MVRRFIGNYLSNREKDEYEVKYLIVDRSTARLYAKITAMRNMKHKDDGSVKEIKARLINKLMHDINLKFCTKIQDHEILKKVIDSCFPETQIFYVAMGIIYIAFNFFPFIL